MTDQKPECAHDETVSTAHGFEQMKWCVDCGAMKLGPDKWRLPRQDNKA